jgi:5-hydroxyisourate hydrolase
MSGITTHVLDQTTGGPAQGVVVVLERKTHRSGWERLAESSTDADGRVEDLLREDEAFLSGHYRVTFETGPYFLAREIESFYPQVTVVFTVKKV